MSSTQRPRNPTRAFARAFATLGAVALLLRFGYLVYDPPAISVAAVAETASVRHAGDAADDPAIWLNPEDPAASLIVGTDKKGALGLYDLSGRELQYVEGARYNNVDVRSRFPLRGREVPLVASGAKDRDQIVFFTIDVERRRLVEIEGTRIDLGVEPEGVCLYRSPRTGRTSVFAVGDSPDSDDDWFEQWEVTPDASAGIHSRRVRRVRIGGKSEGAVADDREGFLYVAEEDAGIWRFDAEPEGGGDRRLVAQAGLLKRLRHDVEGLAIYSVSDPAATRYLIASSQGTDDFAVFRLGDDLTYAGRFEVVDGPATDRVTHSDGIDVVASDRLPGFPGGLFVCQDDEEDDGNQNFKLVPWQSIADGLGLP